MVKTTQVDVKELLKAGVHFGHKSSHWNPKMTPYIHSQRGGVYIIDLIKTAEKLAEALSFVEEVAAKGKKVLFVGTKRHIRDEIKAAAAACGMPYVTQRWFGGTLTNFSTISKRIKYFLELEKKFETDELSQTYSKREVNEFKEELAKLNEGFGGIKELTELPAAIFVADVLTDATAVKEANKLGVPLVAMVDTNTDPTVADYPVPANDDAISSVKIISQLVAEAVKRGATQAKQSAEKAAAAKPKPIKKPAETAEKS